MVISVSVDEPSSPRSPPGQWPRSVCRWNVTKLQVSRPTHSILSSEMIDIPVFRCNIGRCVSAPGSRWGSARLNRSQPTFRAVLLDEPGVGAAAIQTAANEPPQRYCRCCCTRCAEWEIIAPHWPKLLAIPDPGHDCRADAPGDMSCGGGESGPTGLPPYVCVRVSPRERRRETLRAGPSSL